jgi:hypothetical protein
MNKITNYELRIPRIAFCLLLWVAERSRSTAFCFLLSAFQLFLLFCSSALHAQSSVNQTLDTDTVPKVELIITSEVEEEIIDIIYWMHSNLSVRSHPNIKKWEQTGALELGKAIPDYQINNEKLTSTGSWHIPVFCDGEPLILVSGAVAYQYNKFVFNGSREAPLEDLIHNYEHKDLIVGLLKGHRLMKTDYLIIRKNGQDVFLEVYDEVTGLYFKNEYSFSEIINQRKKLELQEKEKRQNRFNSMQTPGKSELTITSEIEEMLVTHRKNMSEKFYSTYGIKNRAQLDSLEVGKPIPYFTLHNDSIKFTGAWRVPLLSNGEPLFFEDIKIEDNGNYKWAGARSAKDNPINNYKHKDLITGFLGVGDGVSYLMIRKNSQDIFVKTYDWETRESLKTEYSLQEIINLNKK